ncbi:hypothetical protein [Nocardioides sp. InS609-2]|uniref:hypothetical protein n=1 Tax=Nocardioides sp. InS609-2 TaxID=2760705 RepID=UPI0020BEED5B|nr:hypothetical protein [Nocardioides sp. InS609-2]
MAAPIAVVATASAVTFGVVAAQPDAGRDLMASSGFQASVGGSGARGPVVTRGSSRMAKAEKQIDAARQEIKATNVAVRNADTKLWTTEELNLWSGPGRDDVRLGVVKPSKQVLVTGREQGEREEIVVDGDALWVSSGYLDDEEPVAGIGGSCTNGTSVPSGVSPNIAKVHAAVCAAFPQITTYGTFRGDGEHAQGRAVDIMVSGATGWDVANFVRAHYAELGVEYLIHAQKIWSVERGGEGWRGMSDRGSITANHYDHVHVTTY